MSYHELSQRLANSIEVDLHSKKTIRAILTHSKTSLNQQYFTIDETPNVPVDRFTSNTIMDYEYEKTIYSQAIGRFSANIARTHENSFFNLLRGKIFNSPCTRLGNLNKVLELADWQEAIRQLKTKSDKQIFAILDRKQAKQIQHIFNESYYSFTNTYEGIDGYIGNIDGIPLFEYEIFNNPFGFIYLFTQDCIHYTETIPFMHPALITRDSDQPIIAIEIHRNHELAVKGQTKIITHYYPNIVIPDDSLGIKIHTKI